jgi:hypothetical protein
LGGEESLWEAYEVCRRVPELAGLPAAEGVAVYRRIRGRVWRCGAFWREMVWPGVVVVLGGPVVGVVWRWVCWPATVGERVGVLTWLTVFTLVAMKVLGPRVEGARRRALGRLARGEVGRGGGNGWRS